MAKVDPREIIVTLDMYSRLAWRLANEANGLALEARALQLQIDATIGSLYKESRKIERWYVRFWNRLINYLTDGND